MLRYRDSTINKLTVATGTSEPKPFPGKYPTRLYIVYKDSSTYIGKPFAYPVAYDATFITEFDRAHILTQIDVSARKVVYQNRVFHFYHPSTFAQLPGSANSASFTAFTKLAVWFNLPFRALRLYGLKYPTYASKSVSVPDFGKRYLSELKQLQAPGPGENAKKLKLTRAREKSIYDVYNAANKYYSTTRSF